MLVLKKLPDGPYALGGPRTILGRLAEADVVLHCVHASARHAEIRWRCGGWELRDLASTNGTFCNGQVIAATTPVVLSAKDRLRFGDAEEEWEVVDWMAPWPCLFDPTTGQRQEADGGTIGALAFQDLETGEWRDASGARLEDGTIVGGLRLGLPPVDAVATTMRNPVRLENCQLLLRTSRDMHQVDLRLTAPGWQLDLSGRAWAVAVYVLARARLAEADGWLDIRRLARRCALPRKVLDVHLARAREALVRGGLADGMSFVEVRPGGRRLGLGRAQLTLETT